MGWENLVGYKFFCLFIQYKVAKGEIFTTVLQKDVEPCLSFICFILIMICTIVPFVFFSNAEIFKD